MNELKPCPFCGKRVRRIVRFGGLNFFRCRRCGATVSFDNDYYNTHKNEAVNAWNRRALTGDNPTPITKEQARENLLEEIADVSLCLKALGLDHIDREFCLQITRASNEKARRWAGRIKEKYESAER